MLCKGQLWADKLLQIKMRKMQQIILDKLQSLISTNSNLKIMKTETRTILMLQKVKRYYTRITKDMELTRIMQEEVHFRILESLLEQMVMAAR